MEFTRDTSRRKEVSGHFPECGAIFMSNRSTLRECFEKRLLGLPDSRSDFVTRVKAGMILFLFEFQERKLYGVFEAISDGAINIVPHAYASSGKWFPAQVKFTTIWQCDPLSEDEFCDAIRDNYFDTYKFNFGLSKDQIQSLLWLFSSRKLKIPNSLHHNRWKNREKHYSFQSEVKKGRFTDIEISGRKLNVDAKISVIAEVERHSWSSDSCRTSESIHFDDDAYDPEHPGFHHSAGFEAHSGAFGHELLTWQEKKEDFHVSNKDTEDYIPLSSPDHSEPEKDGFDSNECSGEEEIDMFVGNKVSIFPVPQLPLGPTLNNEGYNQTKMEPLFASSHGGPCYRSDDSFPNSLPLSGASDFQSKDGSNNLKTFLSKSMYSDSTYERSSVFSRLNFSSKDMAEEDQNDANVETLVNDMSRVKHQSHDQCEKKENVKPQKHVIEDWYVDKGTSVFMRLTSASDTVTQGVHCMTGLKQETGGWKKRKNVKLSFSERKYYKEVDKALNQSQEMLASECEIQSDGVKQDVSTPQIMDELCQRRANWRKMMGKTDFLKQANEYHRVDKKCSSVFSRLSSRGEAVSFTK